MDGEAVVDDAALLAAAVWLPPLLLDVGCFLGCLGDFMTDSVLRAAADSAGVGSLVVAVGEMVLGDRGLSAGLIEGDGGFAADLAAAGLRWPLVLVLVLLSLLLLLLSLMLVFGVVDWLLG